MGARACGAEGKLIQNVVRWQNFRDAGAHVGAQCTLRGVRAVTYYDWAAPVPAHAWSSRRAAICVQISANELTTASELA